MVYELSAHVAGAGTKRTNILKAGCWKS